MKIRKFAAVLFITVATAILMSGHAFAATNSNGEATCATCHGTGKTTCTWCKGTGQMSAADVSYTCVTCKGTGQMNCLGCFGKGTKTVAKKQKATAKAQIGAGSVQNSTSAAAVINPVPVMSQISSQMDCPVCRGAGKRVCHSCSGNGFTEAKQYGPNYGYGSSVYWSKSSCAACRNTGLVPCTYCGGDGKL